MLYRFATAVCLSVFAASSAHANVTELVEDVYYQNEDLLNQNEVLALRLHIIEEGESGSADEVYEGETCALFEIREFASPLAGCATVLTLNRAFSTAQALSSARATMSWNPLGALILIGVEGAFLLADPTYAWNGFYEYLQRELMPDLRRAFLTQNNALGSLATIGFIQEVALMSGEKDYVFMMAGRKPRREGTKPKPPAKTESPAKAESKVDPKAEKAEKPERISLGDLPKKEAEKVQKVLDEHRRYIESLLNPHR